MTNGKSRRESALGLIETAGLVAAVEAADVGAKTAAVRLVGYELVTGGLVAVKFRGEVAAVRAAVEAGREAASRIGKVVSTHVIARPHEDTECIVPIPPGQGRPPDGAAQSAGSAPSLGLPPSKPVGGGEGPASLSQLPVRELRRLARSIEGIGLTGREISRAGKAQLLVLIRQARQHAEGEDNL